MDIARDAERGVRTEPTPAELAVLWHDIECGGYDVDLPTWQALAREQPGPLVELGSGTGRVALPLAASGTSVLAVESDPELAAELERRAAAKQLELGISVERSDATRLELADESISAVLAPMQFLHLLSPAELSACLDLAARCLRPGGILAAAILTDMAAAGAPPDGEALPPLPDVREHAGWVLSSLPLDVRRDQRGLVVRRLRQLVAPRGGISESLDEVRLWELDADRLASIGRAAGLAVVAKLGIPSDEAYADSTVVVLERR